MNGNIIELLAPAGSASIGRAAIDAGADAVYIGGELFSARAAAGNSIEDIASLCHYAHLFGVKIYLALNTLLGDDQELKAAKNLALQAIEAGIDAIIFQDVRLLDMGLPIEMHASTQTFNLTTQRVVELERAGCSRVVLERALSIDEIRAIRAASMVELETFVHGAICVGYSGVCGLSEHLTGRSGNRGQCAQPCRSLYDLLDADGRVLIENKALLSPRDMNLSARVEELIDAGVTSLKIEGRLKESDYVQNVVAHYDEILKSLGARRSSRGVVRHNFAPDVRLSFNRGFTEWFFDGITTDKRLSMTAPPPGEAIGRVTSIDNRSITVNLDKGVKISNGDGICFRAQDGKIEGVRVNRVEANRLFLLSTKGIERAIQLYRNSAVDFRPSSARSIEVEISIDNQNITATDFYGNYVSIAMPLGVQMATNSIRATDMLRSGMSKSGGTIFIVRSITINCEPVPFMTSSAINELRRKLLEKLEITYSKNIICHYAHTSSESIVNAKPDYLMRSRFCILREHDMCLKTNRLKLPLTLRNNNRLITLSFNCNTCEMTLRD